MRVVLAFALVTLNGCTFFTGVDATPQDCTLARAGADTTTVHLTGAAGDTVAVASVRWCRP